MTDRNANRPGYKKTRVGWIPENWDILHLEEISDVNKENLSSSTPEVYSFTYINLSDVNRGKINISSKKIDFSKAPSRARRIVHEGDILLSTVRPNLKGFGYIDFSPKDIICSTGFAVLTPKNRINGNYLYQYVFSEKAEKYFYACVVGSNYPALNNSDIQNMRIPVPTLAEQKKIAEILSTWDWAIEQTRALIAAKRRLKMGLMQQLLTGRMRFPGFGPVVEKAGELPGGWEEKRINQIGKVVSGGTPATNDERNWAGNIAWVTPNEVTQIKGPYIDSTERTLTELGLKNSSAQMLPPNSIIVCTRATIGDCVINTIPIATNQGFKSVSPNTQFEEKYIYYSIIFNKKKLLRLGAGSTFLEVSRRDFEKMQFLVPLKTTEQIRISDLLIGIDKQILLLEKVIRIYFRQKNGLMQKLLSGEIRTNNKSKGV